jgi:hypothetical protein
MSYAALTITALLIARVDAAPSIIGRAPSGTKGVIAQVLFHTLDRCPWLKLSIDVSMELGLGCRRMHQFPWASWLRFCASQSCSGACYRITMVDRLVRDLALVHQPNLFECLF